MQPPQIPEFGLYNTFEPEQTPPRDGVCRIAKEFGLDRIRQELVNHRQSLDQLRGQQDPAVVRRYREISDYQQKLNFLKLQKFHLLRL